MKRRLQNKIAESSVTLPVACGLATVLWWLPQGTFSTDYVLGWVVCAVMTYIFIEMNAVNSLLRIRSRMISSLFLLVMTACGFLHPFQTGLLVSLAVLIALFFLFKTYDVDNPQLPTFHAYLCFSLGSFAWPPLLLLLPLMLWNQGVFMRSLRPKTFGAAILGLLLPYMFLWGFQCLQAFLAALPAFQDQKISLLAFLPEERASFPLVFSADSLFFADFFNFTAFPRKEDFLSYVAFPPTREVSNCVFLFFLGLTGLIHYIRKSYDDKINVRMKYYSLLTFQVATTMWLVLQPKHFCYIFPVLLVTTVPAAAHFITFTRTFLTNAWCFILTIALITLIVQSQMF